MKTFIQTGNIVPVPAPAGGVLSGGGVLIDSLFGIAHTTAEAGASVEISTVGVFDLAKDAGAVTLGAKVYWDAEAKLATATATDNTLIGTAIAPAGPGNGTVRVRLNGIVG